MAPALKDILGPDAVRALATALHRVHPSLRTKEFTKDGLAGLESLELKARASHLGDVLAKHLPQDREHALRILVASLGPEEGNTDAFGREPLRYMVHVAFVGTHCLEVFEPAMRAQEAITKRFTAEWCIRPFLVRHPHETYAQLLVWAKDRNVHLRRLASEGCRPRLPWAARLPAFQKDPAPVLALLELLKDDPERYVQRSVANNLNDIAKDHPDRIAALCQAWSRDAPPGRAWIVNHALRVLVKAGHQGALDVLGVGAKPSVTFTATRILPRQARIGGRVELMGTLTSTSKKPQELVVDWCVAFVKANGSTRDKVFKLKRVSLPAGAQVELRTALALVQLSTRTHHPGRHVVTLLVNGERFPWGSFELQA